MELTRERRHSKHITSRHSFLFLDQASPSASAAPNTLKSKTDSAHHQISTSITNMASLLDQDFPDEEDEDDFNPQVEVGSDDEADAKPHEVDSDDGRPASRRRSDDVKEEDPAKDGLVGFGRDEEDGDGEGAELDDDEGDEDGPVARTRANEDDDEEDEEEEDDEEDEDDDDETGPAEGEF